MVFDVLDIPFVVLLTVVFFCFDKLWSLLPESIDFNKSGFWPGCKNKIGCLNINVSKTK